MPDESTNQTPQEGGTGNQTPPVGTDGQKAADAAPQPRPAIDYESKFKSSQAEAMRLYQENQRLQQMLSHTTRTQPQPQQTVSDTKPYEDLTDAVLDRDYNKIKSFEDRIIDRAAIKISEQQQQAMGVNQRRTSSMQVVQDAFKDPNSPVAYEAIKRYQEILVDPAYNYIENDEIEFSTPQGPLRVNPHKMRTAIMEAKASINARAVNAASSIADGAPAIEPASGTASSTKSKTFDPNKHLTERERAYCDKVHEKYDEYWKNIRPSLKDARLRAGRAISSKEAGV